MISKNKVIEIICIADDFCREFEKEVAKKALSDNQYFVKFYAASAANPNISFTIS